MKENYRAWDITPMKSPKLGAEFYLHLIGWAVLAANSHNSQPWRFIIQPKRNAIDIWLDLSKTLSDADPTNREAIISVGCALENLFLAAGYYGAQYRVLYNDRSLARIIFSSLKELPDKDPRFLNAMKTRRVNRSMFIPSRSVPPKVLDEMRASARLFGISCDIITDTPTLRALGGLQYLAGRVFLANKAFRRELAPFFIANHAQDDGRGMPGKTFGLDDAFTDWFRDELAKDGKFDSALAHRFASSDGNAMASSPAVVVMSVPIDTPQWWLKAGRAFQKCALIAQMHDLDTAVHAAMVEAPPFNALLRLRLLRRQRPTFVFRVGYATETRPHSPRVPAEKVTRIV